MSEFNRTQVVDETGGLNAYITKVFTRMGIGLLVTAAVAYLGYATGFLNAYLTATGGFGVLLPVIAEFGIVIALSRGLASMKTSTASALFYVYAAVTGFTFSSLFDYYGVGTVGASFAFTAVLFFSCAVIGHTTNRDLSKFSTLLMGGLIALIVASVVSMFVPALAGSLVISYLGIIVFLGLTAYDMQTIKSFYYGSNEGYGQLGGNLAVYGAMQLYLDFINIFLYVLQILGSRSRRN